MLTISKWTMAVGAVLVAAILASQSAQATTTSFSRTLTCSSWTQIGTYSEYSCTAYFKLPATGKATIQSVNASCPQVFGSVELAAGGMSVTVNTVISGTATSQTIPSSGIGLVPTNAGNLILVATAATDYADAGSTVSATFFVVAPSATTSFGACTVVFVGEL